MKTSGVARSRLLVWSKTFKGQLQNWDEKSLVGFRSRGCLNVGLWLRCISSGYLDLHREDIVQYPSVLEQRVMNVKLSIPLLTFPPLSIQNWDCCSTTATLGYHFWRCLFSHPLCVSQGKLLVFSCTAQMYPRDLCHALYWRKQHFLKPSKPGFISSNFGCWQCRYLYLSPLYGHRRGTVIPDPFYNCAWGVNESHLKKCIFLSVGDKGSSVCSAQTQAVAMQTHPGLVRLTPFKMTKFSWWKWREKWKRKEENLRNLPPKHLF